MRLRPRPHLRNRTGGGEAAPDAMAPVSPTCTLLTINTAKTGMAAAFDPIYKLIFMLTCVVYTGLVMVAWYDIVAYGFNEASQKYRVTKDKNVFIDQTNDFSVIQYSTKDTTTEPYNIYYCQKIIGYVINGIVIMMCTLGINIFLYFGLFFYKKVKGELLDKSVQLGFDSDLMAIILTMSVLGGACKVLYSRYQKAFVNDTLVRISDTRTHLDNIRKFTTDNIPFRDTFFLQNLKANNLDAIANSIADELWNSNGITTTVSPKALISIQKKLFTCDLYNYFKDTIPVTDPMYDNIDDLFSANGAILDIDVNRYFYYSQVIQIQQAAWNDLSGKVLASFNTNHHDMPSSADWTSIQNQLTTGNLTDRFNDMVEKDLQAGNLRDSKLYLKTYLWTFALIATAFLAVVLLINYRCIPILSTAFAWIYSKTIQPLIQWLFVHVKITLPQWPTI